MYFQIHCCLFICLLVTLLSNHERRKLILLFFLWRCAPKRAMASSFLKILNHTQRSTTVATTPPRRRDLYLTTDIYPCTRLSKKSYSFVKFFIHSIFFLTSQPLIYVRHLQIIITRVAILAGQFKSELLERKGANNENNSALYYAYRLKCKFETLRT
jgi:hypothetical protein